MHFRLSESKRFDISFKDFSHGKISREACESQLDKLQSQMPNVESNILPAVEDSEDIPEPKKRSSAAKPRAILDKTQVVAIFNLRPASSSRSKMSETVARAYRISDKAVRDIWSGRTWRQETQHLDPSRPVREAAPPGRPVGRKDTVPRRCQITSTSKRAQKMTTMVANAEDPFHDDWPNWARADVFCSVSLPPFISMPPRTQAHSLGIAMNSTVHDAVSGRL